MGSLFWLKEMFLVVISGGLAVDWWLLVVISGRLVVISGRLVVDKKSNIQHWDRNSNAHFKPSQLDAQRSYRDVLERKLPQILRSFFLARPQGCRSNLKKNWIFRFAC